MTTFEQAQPIADTVLFEGYMLYPYRANDAKNRVRWQFGVLAPPLWSRTDPSERSFLQTDLLLDGRPGAVETRLRLLQVQRRTVQRLVEGRPVTVTCLDAGDTVYRPFDEAVPRELDLRHEVADLLDGPVVEQVEVAGGTSTEQVPGGLLRRERLTLYAAVTLAAEPLPGPYGTVRLRIRVDNTTSWRAERPQRADALQAALVAAHLLVRVDRGRFLSLTDPPEWANGYVAQCDNQGVWPVLGGDGGADDLVLCSPIILPDHPQVAPESSTQFCDGLEMDELLSLRAMTLTDEEKRAVRGTDPRAAALLDQVDHLPGELMDRLHGAVRSLTAMPRIVGGAHPAQEVPPADGITVGGVRLSAGSRVILRPGARRADAQDLFLAGRTATVTKVMHDLDGHDHVAVLLEDDPGQDVARIHGRYLYFAPDELEPLGARR